MDGEKYMSKRTVVREVVVKNGLVTSLDLLFRLTQNLGNRCDDICLEKGWLSWVSAFKLRSVFLPKNCRANQTKQTSSSNQRDEKVAETPDLRVKLSLI